eukprot:scaffold174999_cov52-Attheya_sp.AAC.2
MICCHGFHSAGKRYEGRVKDQDNGLGRQLSTPSVTVSGYEIATFLFPTTTANLLLPQVT